MATEQTVFDVTIYVPYSTDLFVIVGGKQSYSSLSGSIPWDLIIYIDGSVANSAGGAGAYTDSPSLFATAGGIAPGYHEVKVTWTGSTALSIHGLSLLILGLQK